MSFRFESTNYFYYLLVLALVIPLMWYAIIYQSRKLRKIFDAHILEALAGRIETKRRYLKSLLEIIIIILLVLALARPQSGESTEKIKMEGIELVFALDLSNSMMAEDLKPSRLELAKKTISRLLDRLSGFKVGLIGFAGNAVLLSPLTTDYSALKLFLDSANPDAISSQGTNFSSVIEAAKEAFQRGGTENDELSRVTKVIIFLSDGEDHEEGALKQARALVDQGIRIFSVGVGTAQGAPIPIRDEFGNLKGYKKDNSNQTVVSKVNSSFMQQLAREGKGSYYHASFDGSEVLGLEKDLNKLEKTEFESDFMRKYDENYHIPLLLALLLLFVELLIPDRSLVVRRKS